MSGEALEKLRVGDLAKARRPLAQLTILMPQEITLPIKMCRMAMFLFELERLRPNPFQVLALVLHTRANPCTLRYIRLQAAAIYVRSQLMECKNWWWTRRPDGANG